MEVSDATMRGVLQPFPEWSELDSQTRERLLRVVEFHTTDESVRRNKIVDAEIRDIVDAPWNSFLDISGDGATAVSGPAAHHQ